MNKITAISGASFCIILLVPSSGACGQSVDPQGSLPWLVEPEQNMMDQSVNKHFNIVNLDWRIEPEWLLDRSQQIRILHLNKIQNSDEMSQWGDPGIVVPHNLHAQSDIVKNAIFFNNTEELSMLLVDYDLASRSVYDDQGALGPYHYTPAQVVREIDARARVDFDLPRWNQESVDKAISFYEPNIINANHIIVYLLPCRREDIEPAFVYRPGSGAFASNLHYFLGEARFCAKAGHVIENVQVAAGVNVQVVDLSDDNELKNAPDWMKEYTKLVCVVGRNNREN